MDTILKGSKTELRVVMRMNGLRTVDRYSTIYYILRKGEIKPGDHSRRRLLWAKDEGRTYYTCLGCSRINKLETTPKVGPYIMLGRHLMTVHCEHCQHCGTHVWYIFEDWVERRLAGKIKMNSMKCPFCRASAVCFSSAPVHSVYCAGCYAYWEPYHEQCPQRCYMAMR